MADAEIETLPSTRPDRTDLEDALMEAKGSFLILDHLLDEVRNAPRRENADADTVAISIAVDLETMLFHAQRATRSAFMVMEGTFYAMGKA
jgi:hypothetical protein